MPVTTRGRGAAEAPAAAAEALAPVFTAAPTLPQHPGDAYAAPAPAATFDATTTPVLTPCGPADVMAFLGICDNVFAGLSLKDAHMETLNARGRESLERHGLKKDEDQPDGMTWTIVNRPAFSECEFYANDEGKIICINRDDITLTAAGGQLAREGQAPRQAPPRLGRRGRGARGARCARRRGGRGGYGHVGGLSNRNFEERGRWDVLG